MTMVRLDDRNPRLAGADGYHLAASQMAQQISQMNPGAAAAGVIQPGQDPDKLFQSEAENLEVLEHWSVLDGIEDRILARI
jgi:ER membrane protein complex subunit 3